MNSSDFDAVWADAAPVLDTVFAEEILVTPRSGAQYTSQDDINRNNFIVRGIYDPKTMLMRQAGNSPDVRSQTDRLDDRVQIDFAVSEFSSRDQWPKKGDRLTLSSRDIPLSFEVVAPDTSGHGRIAFKCVRIVSS